jgi:hypothetical protein
MSETKTSRSTPALNPKLNQALTNYVAAATAAGVALLAANPAAEAKVVYTPANQQLTFSGAHTQIPFDINGDGIPDITFSWGTLGYGSYIAVGPAAGNGIVGAPGSAAALVWGTRVGPKDAFVSSPELMVAASGCHSKCSVHGPWANVYDRFLGVKFLISGQIHYGWVNLNMHDNAEITGYAYETIPNKPLVAGEKTEPQASVSGRDLLAPSSQPATLGMLARGADSLAIWRREENVVVQ